jgi:hypothetical protein
MGAAHHHQRGMCGGLCDDVCRVTSHDPSVHGHIRMVSLPARKDLFDVDPLSLVLRRVVVWSGVERQQG